MAQKQTGLKPAEEKALLEELRDRFQYAKDYWREIRDEATTDMRYVAGDPWESKDREAREAAGRPCLALDELGQYFNQVINDLLANPRAMKFAPTGKGANDQGAEFYQNKAREIEYRSHAQLAYVTAAENAIQRSYGYCRLQTKYTDAGGFEQDIWIEPIVNPDTVLIDPDAQRPDGSDMGWGFIFEQRSHKEFRREFPWAKVKDFSLELQTLAPNWIHSDKIQLAEYWTIKQKTRTLLELKPMAQPARPGSVLNIGPHPPAPQPTKVYEDELHQRPSPDQILNERIVEEPTVCQYLTNGVEILSVTEWPGKYIPIACCFGKVLYVDEGAGVKRKILSMTRLARSPFMAYCFYRTCEIENVGMTTKNPYWAYDGQLTPLQMTEIQKSLHEPVAVLLAKATVEGVQPGVVLPLPQRNLSEPAIQALSVGAEEMRRAIQAAMGSNFLPTQAQRRNEKSGIALEKMDRAAQKGTYHFVHHYDNMIRHVGVMIEDLMDKVHDSPRDTGVRLPNDTAKVVRINDATVPKDQQVFTKGDYQVTVSTGPAYDSEREAAADFADTLIASPMMQLLGPEKGTELLALAIKLKNIGPIGDEMAEIIAPSKAKDGQSDPKQLQRALMEAQGKLQQLGQVAQQMKQAIDTDAAKQQATIKKAEIDATSAMTIARERNATTIAVAHIAAAAKGLALDAHAEEEAQALGHAQFALAHDADQQEHDRAHDAALSQLEHEQAMAQGQQGHQQALEQGEQGQQHALEQGEQQAALTPPEPAA